MLGSLTLIFSCSRVEGSMRKILNPKLLPLCMYTEGQMVSAWDQNAKYYVYIERNSHRINLQKLNNKIFF